MGAGGHRCRLGNADLRFCAVAGCTDLGLCGRAARAGDGAMIIALFNVYLVILFILVKTKIVPFNLFWKVSPAIVLLLLLVGLFIPMGWGAPQGPAMVVRNSVQIVPSVAGEVVDVPVIANTPVKEGDVLFRIDPVPYEATVKALEAQLKLAEQRLGEMSQL